MKSFARIVIALALATLVIACAAPLSAQPSAPIVDAAGRSVSLKGTPKRIVSLSPSNTEILYALGLGDQVVGVTEYCDYPAEAKAKPKVGGFSNIDVERVVSLNPDLVLASNVHVAKTVPALEAVGMTVFVVDPQSVDDIAASLVTLGQLTGHQKEAEAVRASMASGLKSISDKVKDASPKPRVFWLIGPGHEMYTAGPGSYANDLIEKAGGVNIAASAKTKWPQMSVEAVVQADPEAIILPGKDGDATAAALRADPAWAGVSAVKQNRFVFVADENLVNRPVPRVVDGVAIIARGLHPDRFK